MKILNPLYDSAFKYLMEDNNIAKTVLSIILDTKIVDLQAKPQETSLPNGLFRFDYKAIIQDDNGDYKTVLVEVQKYNSPNPLNRFRQYLGINYAGTETIATEKEEQSLPIVSIYILGFDLSEFNCRAIKAKVQMYDIVKGEPINVKSLFVEKLTHESYFLIAKDKDTETQNTLVEQLLDLFIQKLKGEKSNPIIEIDEDSYNNEIIPIIERLKNATLDSDVLRTARLEKDYLDNEISKDKQLKEAKERIETEKQRVKAEKQKVEAERQAKEQKQKQLEETVKLLLSMQVEIDIISEKTGLSKSEIEKLK